MKPEWIERMKDRNLKAARNRSFRAQTEWQMQETERWIEHTRRKMDLMKAVAPKKNWFQRLFE